MTDAQRDQTAPTGGGPDVGYVPRRLDGPIVVGVVPGQGLAVVHRAVDLAHSLGVDLVCVYADPTTVQEPEPGGRVEVVPIDPDAVDDDAAQVRADLAESLELELRNAGVNWRFAALSGEPAHALGAYAEELGASIVVVGTRDDGLAHRWEERIVGSVAIHLAHQQDRPVVVVPLRHHHGRRHGRGNGPL